MTPGPIGTTLGRSDMRTQEPSAARPPSPKVSRRQLVGLGATGLAGAVVAKMATADAAPAARAPVGGIHIDDAGKAVYPDASKGLPHTFIKTLWSPDNGF